MSFKNYWADLLEIFIESVKVYTNCVYEISQRSESNSVFENQKIEITYKNYSSLDTWATLMKQKLNYSQSVEQEHDTFRYVKNSLEKYGVIRIEFSHIYINVTNDVVPPPFKLWFVSSYFASVWEFSMGVHNKNIFHDN